MVSFFIKRLVQNRDNVSDPKVRRAYGAVCGFCGIGINLLLFLGKLIAGFLSGSIAITADAFNNLSDAGSSIVTLVGFRMAAQAPDKDHPFGHGRFEYISGMMVSAVILLMGLGLLRSGAEKIFRPEAVDASPIVIIILIVSILFKLYMAYYNNKYGKIINSAAMQATAVDSISDCAATSAVLLSALIGIFTSVNIDGWAGAIVSVLIIIAGIKSLHETIDPLLGHAPDKEFVKGVEKIVMAHREALGIHDLAVHDYGPGHTMVSLHVEVDGSGNIYELHEAIDAMEREISTELDCEAVIHMDPIAVDDQQTHTLSGEVAKLIRENIDEEITIHDFRIVPGAARTNLIFDSAIPPRLSHEAGSIKAGIEKLVEDNFENCFAVTKIDISLT